MIENIPKSGSIITYYKPFEKGVIKDLSNFCPDIKRELLGLNARIMDLMIPFAKGGYYHPEFDEYILLVSGQGAIIEKGDKEDHFLRMSKGMCVYIPRNTSHVFLATTDCESVSFLTKPWNDCEEPIIHENLGHGKGDFGDPDSVHHDEQHLEAFSEDK